MAPKRSNAKKPSSLTQFGLMDMPDLSALPEDMSLGDSDEDDDSLEAELQAILSGKAPTRPQKRVKPKMDITSIEQIAAAAVSDIPTDEELDENLSADEELVSELMTISKSSSPSPPIPNEATIPSPPPHVPSVPSPPVPSMPRKQETGQSMTAMLEERLQMYKLAESDAKSSGNSGKARRYGRAIKSLENLLKMARAGRPIDEDEIPPPVAIPKPKTENSNNQPAPPNEAVLEPAPRHLPPIPKRSDSLDQPKAFSESSGDTVLKMLSKRRDLYKMAALQAKKMGDTQTAITYIKTAKQFDAVIEAHTQGQPVDLSNMPPPPPLLDSVPVQREAIVPQPSPHQRLTPVSSPPAEEVTVPEGLKMPDNNEVPDAALFGAPPPPTSILEALEQRLAKFQSTLETAQSENNTSKARRVGRIVKQYQDAIKFHKTGKSVDFQELPVPPGFAPFPGMDELSESVEAKGAAPSPPQPKHVEPKRPAPPKPKAPDPPKQPPVTRQPSVTNRITKQLEFLVERQRLFREAALESKKHGDIEQAKEYLRMAKGIEPMIEGTRNGLPVNIASIPTPPQLTEDFVVLDVEKKRPTVPGLPGDPNELYRKLEMDLVKQIEMCVRNKDHYIQLGDIASVSKFEKLAHDTHKDLDVIRNLWDRGDPLPKFHYETRVFSLVISNTDLSDNDLELTILRGIELPGKPTDLDSYIRVEFPYPNDSAPKVKTQTVKDTNNPVFNATFKFEINRKSRSFARAVKRHTIKLEVWSKGGFLRSDSHLGTANIKLADLETKCTIHGSFELTQNRKPCGGRIEAKVRVRDPFVTKQIEEVKEKWLVIGS